MIMEEYILFVSSLRNDKKFENEVQLRISIEILFKNVYEKYEKVSELYFVMGLSDKKYFFELDKKYFKAGPKFIPHLLLLIFYYNL